MIVSNPLQHEILEHAIQCKTYVAKFHGRTDVLDKVGNFIQVWWFSLFYFCFKLHDYVTNDAEHRPCIVYGASGCGKTSIIAKTAIEVYIKFLTLIQI